MDNAGWFLCNRVNEEFVIKKSNFQAGRTSGLDLVCLSNKVSRKHADFMLYPNGTLFVTDNNSANGTYINCQRIEPNRLYQLHVNDEVGLGLHSKLSGEAFGDEHLNDLKYVFTVRKRLSKAVIVLDDALENLRNIPSTEALVDILDSEQKLSTDRNRSSTKCLQLDTYDKLQTNGNVESSDSAILPNCVESNSTSQSKPTEKVEQFIVNHLQKDSLCATGKYNGTHSSVVSLTSSEVNHSNVPQTNERVVPFECASTANHLGLQDNIKNGVQNEKVNSVTSVIQIQPSSVVLANNLHTGELQSKEITCSITTSATNNIQNPITQIQGNHDQEIPLIKRELPDRENQCIKYTVKGGCIIIDDDEDDVELNCSQLLCDEPGPHNADENFHNDSIFASIKQELEELDRPEDGRVYACVDLMDSDGEPNDNWLSDSENNAQEALENCHTDVQSSIQKQNNEEAFCSTKVHEPSRHKFTIPPVIEPHVETKRKNDKKPGKVAKTRVPEKRKVSEKGREYGKKIKLSAPSLGKGKNSAGKGKLKVSVSKEDKEEIQEVRKQKLRELAEGKSKDEVKKSLTHKTGTAKVKVSDSRGKFLTESILMPSTSKTPGAANISSNTNVPNKPQTNSYSKKVSFDDPRHSTKPTMRCNGIFKNCEGIGDILIRFLNWNTDWFLQWQARREIPPICKTQLIRMSQNYSSYADYYNTVMPLLELELWNYVVKGFSETDDLRKKRFVAQLGSEVKMDKYTELQGHTYITKEQNDTMTFIKHEDAVFVQFNFSRSSTNEPSTPMLGYVTNVYKQVLQDKDLMDADLGKALGIVPNASVTFKVLVKSYNGNATLQKYMHVRIIASLVPTTRLIKSVQYLEHSLLRQHVLKPTSALYNLTHVHQEKLISQDNLNPVQYQAVMEATHICLRKEPGIYLIQGPPGTGKSKVIINIIQQLLLHRQNSHAFKNRCILVVAPSNAAVDELALRLINLKRKLEAQERKELKLVRLGPKNMIHATVQNYSLAELTKRNVLDTFLNPDYNRRLPKHVLDLQRKVADLKKSANYKQGNLDNAKMELERACRKVMGRKWFQNYRKTEDTILGNSTIICTTLSSCVGQSMQAIFGRSKTIQCCIVDEATQSAEQETLIPLMLGIDKMVLVGDPKQLPAVILSKEAKGYAYGQSLFSRIMSNFERKSTTPIRMLDTQYRMHPEICKYPSRMFYEGNLNCAPMLRTRSSQLDILKPYLVFNLNIEHLNSQEYSNNTETDCVIKLLDAIVINIKDSYVYSIGIVTPYNSQKDCIKHSMSNKTYKPNTTITVNTVDSFQGQEKDVIIMSCVRDFSNSFVRDEQRLNVAMTRAKHALYIVASDSLLTTCESMGKVYDDARHRRLIQTITGGTSVHQLSNMIRVKR